jgi:hypothetical protein
MAPLFMLIGATAVVYLVAAASARSLRGHWITALRGGLAAMFAMTGMTHFVALREDLIAMVPPALPAPELLVTATGVLELAGAAALLWRPTARWSAAGLALLLVVMFRPTCTPPHPATGSALIHRPRWASGHSCRSSSSSSRSPCVWRSTVSGVMAEPGADR